MTCGGKCHFEEPFVDAQGRLFDEESILEMIFRLPWGKIYLGEARTMQ